MSTKLVVFINDTEQLHIRCIHDANALAARAGLLLLLLISDIIPDQSIAIACPAATLASYKPISSFLTSI